MASAGVIYGSVCSGIEAATVGWHGLGWEAEFYADIDAFPCAVLKHYYQDVPNHGDMNRFKEWPNANLDVLVGGTPCQSFSVAGLRKGLDDPRGNLTLVYLALAAKYRPRWLVWENVPGVLSDDGGRTFGTFIGGLAKLGYGFAYRVLDAQFFRVAQQRRRVFVVGSARGWASAAAVLFERESLSGNPAPSRKARERVALPITSRVDRGGAHRAPEIARCIATREGTSQDWETTTMVAHSLRADGFDASEDGTGRGTPLVPVAHVDVMPTMQNGADTPAGHNARSGHTKDSYIVPVAKSLRAQSNATHREDSDTYIPVAFDARQSDVIQYGEKTGPLDTCGFTIGIQTAMAVRRLTPRECERLQGFPDDYTLIPYKGKPAKDGPRYKALGNSMAVPVMLWIGERIQMVEELCPVRP